MAKFNKQTILEIGNDVNLFSLVAKTLNIKPISLPQTLKRNGRALNQITVILVVADYLKKDPKKLVEESEELEPAK